MAEKLVDCTSREVLGMIAGTVTRVVRPIRRPKRPTDHEWNEAMQEAAKYGWAGVRKRGPADGIEWEKLFPLGRKDDCLSVRECWRVGAWHTGPYVAVDYRADMSCRRKWLWVPEKVFLRLVEQSETDAARRLGHQPFWKWEAGESPCRWRPAFMMPRQLSRLRFTIARVTIMRVQEIDEAGAIACGFEFRGGGDDWMRPTAFSRDWDSQWCAKGLGWDANPWVIAADLVA